MKKLLSVVMKLLGITKKIETPVTKKTTLKKVVPKKKK
jgi:hypothetical protein